MPQLVIRDTDDINAPGTWQPTTGGYKSDDPTEAVYSWVPLPNSGTSHYTTRLEEPPSQEALVYLARLVQERDTMLEEAEEGRLALQRENAQLRKDNAFLRMSYTEEDPWADGQSRHRPFYEN